MGFFSMEHTSFKTWLVANHKLWGIIPVAICLGVAIGLAKLFGKSQEDIDSMASFMFMATLFLSFAFTAAETSVKSNTLYASIALAPILFIVCVFMGEISHNLITTGVIVWTIVSIIVGLLYGFIIRKYSLINYCETVSKIFKLRSSIDIWSYAQTFAFRRGVEAFIFSFMALEMFFILFV